MLGTTYKYFQLGSLAMIAMLQLRRCCAFHYNFNFLSSKARNRHNSSQIPISTLDSISPIDTYNLFGRNIYLKRDDLLQVPLERDGNLYINGNKARKLDELITMEEISSVVVSYGGIQSNSMRALALVCKFRGSKFIYLIRGKAPLHLLNANSGNLHESLKAGMQIVELSSEEYDELYKSHFWSQKLENKVISSIQEEINAKPLLISQGVSCQYAQKGIYKLCVEIRDFMENSIEINNKWKFLIASGTGVMAYYANMYFKELRERNLTSKDIEVVALPCAVNSVRFYEDLLALDRSIGNSRIFPTIFNCSNAPRRQFAEPQLAHLKIWQELRKQSRGIEFDLIYAPRAFELLLSFSETFNPNNSETWSLCDLFKDSNIIYYHCGGIEGNESQLKRYSLKFPNKSLV